MTIFILAVVRHLGFVMTSIKLYLTFTLIGSAVFVQASYTRDWRQTDRQTTKQTSSSLKAPLPLRGGNATKSTLLVNASTFSVFLRYIAKLS